MILLHKVNIRILLPVKIMIKGIIWDLDGTLLDTTEGVMYAVEKTVAQLKLAPLKPDILKQFVGPPMQDSFVKFYGFDGTSALKAANLFRENYKKESLFKATLYPHTMETLRALKNRGYTMGVATNKSHDNALSIVEHFGISSFCDCVLGSDLGGKLKKADIIKKCLFELSIDSDEAVYIGDSSYDLQGAEEVGMQFFGVSYGFGFKKGENMGHTLLDSMREIEEVFV